MQKQPGPRGPGAVGKPAVGSDSAYRNDADDTIGRLSNVVENTSDTVFITDRDGRIEYVNAAFEVTTGYARSDVLGGTPRILKSGRMDGAYYRDLWSTILDGRVFRKALVNRRKNGELYHADQTITPMRGPDGRITHFVAVAKDMTDFRKAQEQEIEMELASLVQQKLYPKAAPQLSGFDVAGAVFPAEAMCGDYYDFIGVPGGALAVTIGDVSGHGFGPALIMAQTRAYLRALSQVHAAPGDILGIINGMLADDLEEHLFVTLFLAVIDPDSRSLVYASGGHETCFLIDREGKVKHELRSSGMALGVADAGDYGTSPEIPIAPGDILVLLTDGLVECQAHLDRFFDLQDCISLIHRYRHEPAQAIIDRVHALARDFMGDMPQNDDITIVICKAES
jgi:sigma-B regulation protein RsbU (phosphoserine phosphatase)